MLTLPEQRDRLKKWIHDETISDEQAEMFLKSAYNSIHTIMPQQLADIFLCETVKKNNLPQEDNYFYHDVDIHNIINYETDKPIIKAIRKDSKMRLYFIDSEVIIKVCKTIDPNDDTQLQQLPTYLDDAVLFYAITLYYQSIQQFNLAKYFEKKTNDILNTTIFRSNFL